MKMKNKKAVQTEDRRKHKEQLMSNRRDEPNLERSTPILIKKPSILVVCEGKNTESDYFNYFKIKSVNVKCIEGYNTISLINKTIQFYGKEKYDQIWCVFDKDDFSDENFNNAILKAHSKKIETAYSNQSFEYWLILHFNDHQGGKMHRKYYNKKINDLLKPFNVKYDGKNSKKITDDFFELLDGTDEKTGKKRVDLAMDRAELIYNNSDPSNPAKSESSTTVFKLVRELLKYR
jgi:hypothetical protein